MESQLLLTPAIAFVVAQQIRASNVRIAVVHALIAILPHVLAPAPLEVRVEPIFEVSLDRCTPPRLLDEAGRKRENCGGGKRARERDSSLVQVVSKSRSSTDTEIQQKWFQKIAQVQTQRHNSLCRTIRINKAIIPNVQRYAPSRSLARAALLCCPPYLRDRWQHPRMHLTTSRFWC